MISSSWVLTLCAGSVVAVCPCRGDDAAASCFRDIPGVKERSRQLLVRPVQESAWAKAGLSQAGSAERSAAARLALAGTELSILTDTDIHVVPVPAGDSEESLSDALMATGLFEFAEPNWIVYPAADIGLTPDDPGFSSQWHLTKIKAPIAWNTFTGDGSITIALVDTGIDVGHPDLAPLLVPGCNAVSRTTQNAGGLVNDVNGHGTEVAGAAAAMGNNSIGVSGVCWTSRIMPIRASNSPSGSAYMSDILYGASWAAAWGARVVSVSYGGVDSAAVDPTAQAIMGYGGLLLWAAGNSGTNLTGEYPSTTVVGGTDWNDNRTSDSNYGRAIDVMAPGIGIYVPTFGGGYGYVTGTSFASPIAAGVLALAWSAAPSMTPNQAMNVLYQSCDPMEPVTEGNATGWGRVNALAALERATEQTVAHEPKVLKAANWLPQIRPGLEARYYSAMNASHLPLFRGTPIAENIVPRINFPAPTGVNPYTFWGCPLAWSFGATIQGFIEVPKTGPYTMTLTSHDGARLFIDGCLVVNHDGVYPTSFRSGTVVLDKGLHPVQCDYFSSTNSPTLILNVRGVGQPDQVGLAKMFKHLNLSSQQSD